MIDRLVKQFAEKEGITEQLKAQDQMAWVGAMNNIRNAAEEIILSELIYSWSKDGSAMLPPFYVYLF